MGRVWRGRCGRDTVCREWHGLKRCCEVMLLVRPACHAHSLGISANSGGNVPVICACEAHGSAWGGHMGGCIRGGKRSASC